MQIERVYDFGGQKTRVTLQNEFPSIDKIASCAGAKKFFTVCDSNTEVFAKRIFGTDDFARIVLTAGEGAKTWDAALSIIEGAKDAALPRDGAFLAVGGGAVSDVAGFAASVYMRGAGLTIVSTTLMGQTDAALGGKTAVWAGGVKNLAGSFYPAKAIFMPHDALLTLNAREWKSGFAEIVKSAIIGGFEDEIAGSLADYGGGAVLPLLLKTLDLKARIVERDPHDLTGERAVLNLGHTAGHALEAALGAGRVTHGEAVAWGIARSCEMGESLVVTSKSRAQKIKALLSRLGYEISAPHPLLKNNTAYERALLLDKKNKDGRRVFVVPNESGAVVVHNASI